MKKFLIIILSFSTVFAQEKEPFSEAQAMLQETVQQTDVSEVEDSYDSGQSPQQRFEESPKHNVHEYDYKQQVIVGGTVMFCVVLAMVLNNNYNPKRGK